jgi:hypothetical protein
LQIESTCEFQFGKFDLMQSVPPQAAKDPPPEGAMKASLQAGVTDLTPPNGGFARPRDWSEA